ncbi:MAG: efflux RND transporter periplasmic adaptor subunit [Bacteriovorax sp.]|nr:efflux RND transporter periplasmic adaptor subunit [Bacteriovorax sp.]
MDRLKLLFEWIIKRKYLSLLFVILLVGIGITARIVIKAYSGQLSAPIQRGKIIDAVYGYGTITTDRRFTFNPHSGQEIDKIFFKEGDIVKKGMPLLQTAERVIIRAPFSGLVHLRPYKIGENTYAAMPMIVLTDITDRYILATMEQQKASRVKVGQKVKISFESLQPKYFWGKVSAIFLHPNKTLIQIYTADLPETILPNMTCNVDILIGERENALLIPISSLANGYVWVKRGKSIPRKVQVTFGVTDKIWAEVLNGDIEAGDRVMIHKH